VDNIRARNFFEQDPRHPPSPRPFEGILDRDEAAYPDIAQALCDFAFELGDNDLDEATIQTAIRVGRARHARRRPDAKPARRLSASHDRRDAVVYYVRRGSMVKIGTTTRLRERMSALRPDEVLAVEPGSYTREAELHQQFRSLRVPGQREWFYAGAPLQQRIKEVLAEHGPPPAGLPTLAAAGEKLET
jgi:hypothetical protein